MFGAIFGYGKSEQPVRSVLYNDEHSTSDMCRAN